MVGCQSLLKPVSLSQGPKLSDLHCSGERTVPGEAEIPNSELRHYRSFRAFIRSNPNNFNQGGNTCLVGVPLRRSYRVAGKGFEISLGVQVTEQSLPHIRKLVEYLRKLTIYMYLKTPED